MTGSRTPGGQDDRRAEQAVECRPRPHPRDCLPALLRARTAGGRGRHDHRRVRGGEGDVLQALPGQGRPGRGLPGEGGRGLDRPAARRGRGRRARPRPTSWWASSTRSTQPVAGTVTAGAASSMLRPNRLSGNGRARAHDRPQTAGPGVDGGTRRGTPARRSPSSSPGPCPCSWTVPCPTAPWMPIPRPSSRRGRPRHCWCGSRSRLTRSAGAQCALRRTMVR